MIIFGVRKSDLGIVASKNCACPKCGNYGSVNYSAEGKYFHVFWIPTFPVGKKGYTSCSDCDYLVWNKELPENLKQEYKFLKGQLKVPFWYFSGLIVLILFISWIAYMIRNDNLNETSYLNDPQVGDVYATKPERGVYSNMKLVKVEKDSLAFFENKFQASGLKGIRKVIKKKDYETDTIRFSRKQILEDYKTNKVSGISRPTKN